MSHLELKDLVCTGRPEMVPHIHNRSSQRASLQSSPYEQNRSPANPITLCNKSLILTTLTTHSGVVRQSSGSRQRVDMCKCFNQQDLQPD